MPDAERRAVSRVLTVKPLRVKDPKRGKTFERGCRLIIPALALTETDVLEYAYDCKMEFEFEHLLPDPGAEEEQHDGVKLLTEREWTRCMIVVKRIDRSPREERMMDTMFVHLFSLMYRSLTKNVAFTVVLTDPHEWRLLDLVPEDEEFHHMKGRKLVYGSEQEAVDDWNNWARAVHQFDWNWFLPRVTKTSK